MKSRFGETDATFRKKNARCSVYNDVTNGNGNTEMQIASTKCSIQER